MSLQFFNKRRKQNKSSEHFPWWREFFYVQNTNEEKCRAYAAAISEAGYALYDKNETS